VTGDFCALRAEERIALAEAQLAEFEAREPEIQAFVCAAADAARRALAAAASGPLSGALIGIKDIIATQDFPTRCGDPDVRDGVIPRHDAWVVARLKALGATILGKTVCTRFGIPIPGPTRNPHDPRHTPGGSSSGSAAAVAAGFVSFAIGTQTAGSTIRPASYCGVVGYKPSFGLLSTEGVQPLSTTLDHIGIFARSPRDAWFLTTAMLLRAPEIIVPQAPARLCILDIPGHTCSGLTHLAERLNDAGMETERLPLPVPWRDFTDLPKDICYWEAARLLLSQKAIPIAPLLQELLEPYLQRDIDFYTTALQRRAQYQANFDALAGKYDAIVLPAALGAAPPYHDTGDAVMNRFWTALHVPATSVPLWRSQMGLPIGLQLVGRLGSDRRLIGVAEWLMRTFKDADIGRHRWSADNPPSPAALCAATSPAEREK
jgi:Asp-tRNA(Asn)/Glu-tRNA(Gln) amidotransferase A subunit family amidase